MACAQTERIGPHPKFAVLGAMCQIQGYTLHLVTRAYLPFRLTPSGQSTSERLTRPYSGELPAYAVLSQLTAVPGYPIFTLPSSVTLCRRRWPGRSGPVAEAGRVANRRGAPALASSMISPFPMLVCLASWYLHCVGSPTLSLSPLVHGFPRPVGADGASELALGRGLTRWL